MEKAIILNADLDELNIALRDGWEVKMAVPQHVSATGNLRTEYGPLLVILEQFS